eukprot:2351427-Rhodomonas_salina.1
MLGQYRTSRSTRVGCLLPCGAGERGAENPRGSGQQRREGRQIGATVGQYRTLSSARRPTAAYARSVPGIAQRTRRVIPEAGYMAGGW